MATQGSLVSETYVLEDCYFIETGSPTTGYTTSNGTLTISDGVYTLTKGSGTGSGATYINFPKTNYPISDFQNKTLTVKTDVISMTASSLKLSAFYNNGSSWSNAVASTIFETGELQVILSIPSYATQVRIRFDIYGDEDNSAVFRDFRLLF